ncbi:MAG: hypothetical protein NC337_13240 [Roseburia sp.]|nr:hypothetical protein [Roseburia sp.]
MSRNRKKHRNRKEALLTDREIRKSAQALADELNFRLLLAVEEADVFFGTILWVDRITVAEIVRPEREKGAIFPIKDRDG